MKPKITEPRIISLNDNSRETFKSEEILKILPNLEEAARRGRGDLLDSISHDDVDVFNNFLKYRIVNPNVDYAMTGYNYIFMTKPKLNISMNSGDYNMKMSYFKYIRQHHPEIIRSLNYLEGGGNFIPSITNLYDRFDVDDITMDETTGSETWRGYQQKLPTHTTSSTAGGSFSISYDELQTPLITYLHKLWLDYIEYVKFGLINPTKLSVKNKEIDYAASLYYFFLEPDGETIRFWGKYTGVMPKSLPYSAFSGERGSSNQVKASIQYMYSFREFLEPEILSEFNNVASGSNVINSSNSDLGSLDKFIDSMDNVLTTNPKETRSYRRDNLQNIDHGRTILSGIGVDSEQYGDVKVIGDGGKYKLLFY